VKYLLTIKRNERSPSSEIPAHHRRNAQCGSNTKTAKRHLVEAREQTLPRKYFVTLAKQRETKSRVQVIVGI
jgi:hypothetical protein